MKTPKQQKPVYRPDYLLALADYLAKVNNQFDLDSWIAKQDEDGDEVELTAAELKKLKGNPKWKALKECGTTGCAMGHAPSVPLLAKAGLKLFSDGVSLMPEYKGSHGFDAGQELFGITYDVARYFFHPDYYDEDQLKEPKVVAERIYEFVANPFEVMNNNSLN